MKLMNVHWPPMLLMGLLMEILPKRNSQIGTWGIESRYHVRNTGCTKVSRILL